MASETSAPEPQPLPARTSLGQVVVPKDAFDLDLKINEGYQSYSSELLRLSLLVIAGLGAVWLKLYLPDSAPTRIVPNAASGLLFSSFICAVLAAGTALTHRYVAADSLAYHLTALRRRERGRAATASVLSDVDIAKKQERQRDKRFLWSGRLLKLSIGALLLSLFFFGACLITFTFHQSRNPSASHPIPPTDANGWSQQDQL